MIGLRPVPLEPEGRPADLGWEQNAANTAARSLLRSAVAPNYQQAVKRKKRRFGTYSVLFTLFCLGYAMSVPADQVDLAVTAPSNGSLSRVYGSVGTGQFGVPIAAGGDIDGDGLVDYAMAAMLADPLGRADAGEVFLVLGNGQIGGALDTAVANPRVLRIQGASRSEHAGSEIWIDDVSGDGLADLLICRQDYSPPGGPIGAGALTILLGDNDLSTFAAGTTIDLANPPATLQLFTIVGADVQDRLCMWARTGDITGDGTSDIVVGADQVGAGQTHRGAVFVIQGGDHLASNTTFNVGDFAMPGTVLAGKLARINPPGTANDIHFGATVQVGDLDGNGRAEVLIAAGLNRAGGSLRPFGSAEVAHGSGGTLDAITGARDGTAYIAWDDYFVPPWPPGLEFNVDALATSFTSIQGGAQNQSFGEELIADGDFNNDGQQDLFVGDLTAAPLGRRTAGLGHVFYSAANLKGRVLDVDNLPVDVLTTQFAGPINDAIAADTAMPGDFDGDGFDDIAFSSPHGAPFQRANAGILHIIYGQQGRWPALVDLATATDSGPLRRVDILGANGNQPANIGDTLAYSGASADVDGNGATDIVTNEMLGDGVAAGTVDVGNLLVIGQGLLQPPLFRDGFE